MIKQAPVDAQNVAFTFTISCAGVAGSPFTRTVTGSATSTEVTGVPAGTVCTAAETTAAGFNSQSNQTFPAVTASTTQTVTFVNTRSAAGPAITVTKSVDPASRPEPGGTFTFTVQVRNNGTVPVVVTAITDDVHGNLDGRGTCDVGATIAAGATYTCSFSVEITGDSGDTETDRITVTVVDPGGQTGTGVSDGVTVSITDAGTAVRGPTIIINNEGRATSTCTATSASAMYQIAQIDVNNRTSSECVATAAPTRVTTTTTTTAPPTHTATPTGKVLARTGSDTLALLAFAMALMVTGYILLSTRLASNKRYEM